LRSALVDFVAASERQTLLSDQIALQGRAVGLLEPRAATGAISIPEITPARLALQKLRQDESDARSQRTEARARLGEAVGVPVVALDDIMLIFDLSAVPAEVSRLTARDARRQALLERADILAGLSDYAASQSALQLEIAKQYPDVRLASGYQLDNGENKWTLGIGIELPVLNRNQGPIAEAEARRALAAVRFEALQATIIAEVDRAVAVYRTAADIVTQAGEVVAVQHQQLRSVEDQFKAGAADGLELVNAQIELASSKIAFVIAEARMQQAFGSLVDAVQDPWDFEQLAHVTSSPPDEHHPSDRVVP
jgi:outer membrane protein TolC